jgi:hypothetical protein
MPWTRHVECPAQERSCNQSHHSHNTERISVTLGVCTQRDACMGWGWGWGWEWGWGEEINHTSLRVSQEGMGHGNGVVDGCMGPCVYGRVCYRGQLGERSRTDPAAITASHSEVDTVSKWSSAVLCTCDSAATQAADCP